MVTVSFQIIKHFYFIAAKLTTTTKKKIWQSPLLMSMIRERVLAFVAPHRGLNGRHARQLVALESQ